MTRHRLCIALCFLWPLAAQAEAEVCDEATMVQSAATLTQAQMPGMMPGDKILGGIGKSFDPSVLSNPSALANALDISPLIDMVEVFDQLVNAFRNATVRAKLTDFVHNANHALNILFNEVDNSITDALVHSSQLGKQAALVIAKMLLDIYERLRKIEDIIVDLSEPLQPSLPSKFNASKIMDPEGMMGMLHFAFNNTNDFLEGTVNGSLAVDEDYCLQLRSLLRRLSMVGSFIKKLQKDLNRVLEDTRPIDESPMVIIAPDIIPSLREYSLVSIRSTVDMCAHFSFACSHAIHASVETLRENGICNIDEAKLVKGRSAAQSQTAPFGMLALLLLAVLNLTERRL